MIGCMRLPWRLREGFRVERKRRRLAHCKGRRRAQAQVVGPPADVSDRAESVIRRCPRHVRFAPDNDRIPALTASRPLTKAAITIRPRNDGGKADMAPSPRNVRYPNISPITIYGLAVQRFWYGWKMWSFVLTASGTRRCVKNARISSRASMVGWP